jgi:hypothetical protein
MQPAPYNLQFPQLTQEQAKGARSIDESSARMRILIHECIGALQEAMAAFENPVSQARMREALLKCGEDPAQKMQVLLPLVEGIGARGRRRR